MNAPLETSRISALARYRWAVASRVVAAALGGYGLSAAFAAMLGLVLVRWVGMAKADAVTLSTMLSFVVFMVAALWVFACRSAGRAWCGVAVPAVALAVGAWALYGGQA